jgi:hypothetical protein
MASSQSGHAYSSEADLQSLLVGRWMLCNPGTPNGYWSAEGVALDLLADGLSYPLFRMPYACMNVRRASTCPRSASARALREARDEPRSRARSDRGVSAAIGASRPRRRMETAGAAAPRRS